MPDKRVTLERVRSDQYALTVDGRRYSLTDNDFAELYQQAIDCAQRRVIDINDGRRPVARGAMPHRALFTLRFRQVYPSGQFPIRGHHLVPDGEYGEADTWSLLANATKRARDGSADSAELAGIILGALGFPCEP